MLHVRPILLSCAAVGLMLAISGVARSQTRVAITYDAYIALDRGPRLHIFNLITPENRAALVREQIQRWLKANRSRLSDAQIAVLEENLAFITPDHYMFPNTAETLARAKALETKTRALLSRDDVYQALYIGADYIPQ
jgi:hypothetical protein